MKIRSHNPSTAHSRLDQADQLSHEIETRLRSLMEEEIQWLHEAIEILGGTSDGHR